MVNSQKFLDIVKWGLCTDIKIGLGLWETRVRFWYKALWSPFSGAPNLPFPGAGPCTTERRTELRCAGP